VSDDLVRHFVVQTNIYAAQYIASHPNLPPHSRVWKWRDTDGTEMKKLLGLIFLMGITHKPTIELVCVCFVYDAYIFRNYETQLFWTSHQIFSHKQ